MSCKKRTMWYSKYCHKLLYIISIHIIQCLCFFMTSMKKKCGSSTILGAAFLKKPGLLVAASTRCYPLSGVSQCHLPTAPFEHPVPGRSSGNRDISGVYWLQACSSGCSASTHLRQGTLGGFFGLSPKALEPVPYSCSASSRVSLPYLRTELPKTN